MSALPPTWTEVSISDIAKETAQHEPAGAEELFYIDIGAVDRVTKQIVAPSKLLGKDAPSRARKVVKTGDTLVSMTRPNLNAVAKVPPELDGQIASTGFEVLRADGVDERWLYYLVRTAAFVDDMSTLVQGALYPAIRPRDIRGYQVPLAPRAEQTRIADKLDAVLARVDACRDRLDRIPDILKRFRQSLISAAVSGRLTKEWRGNPTETEIQVAVKATYSHFVSAPSSWSQRTLDDVCEFIGGSQPAKSTFVTNETDEVVRLIQIRDYKSDRYKVFIPRKLARRFCTKTDVMIGRYGPPIFQILRGLEGAYNVALMKAAPKTQELNLDYLYFWLQSDALLKHVEAGSDRTAGQDGVRKELLYPYPFFLPPMAEQEEIVRRVKYLVALADRLEVRYTAARAHTERLTPALLAKAFRGELVEQDPNDEPASALLARIAAERGADGKPAARGRGRRKAR